MAGIHRYRDLREHEAVQIPKTPRHIIFDYRKPKVRRISSKKPEDIESNLPTE